MYRIGIDLGGTNIVSAVVDENCKIITKAKAKTLASRPANEIFDDIAKTIKESMEQANITYKDVISIGIGTPGSVNKEKGIIEYANNLGFDNVPALEMLRERTGFDKIYFDNDANCAALGEAVAGVGKEGCKDFIAITLGTGVGSGIVVNGKLVVGLNYAAGEMGHHVIVYNGEQCNCGRKGCWERYASATALIAQTKSAMLLHPYSKMWELCDNDINNVSGRTAFQAKAQGDETAIKVIENYVGYLACGITNIVNTFQPDILCVGGGIGNEGENLLAPVRKILENQRYSIHAEKQTKLCSAVLGNDAGIIGAALLDE